MKTKSQWRMPESDLCLPLRQGVLKCIWANVKWSLGCTSWRLTQLAVVLLFLPLLWWHILFWTQLLWHILMCHQNAQPLIQYFSGFCSAPELLHTTLSLAQPLFSFLHYSSYCILLRSVHIMLHCILVCTASYDYQQRLLFLPHLYARRTLPQFAIFSTHIAARALFVK